MVTLPAIAILGAGSMGGAILSGLVKPTVTVEGGIRVTNRSETKASALRAAAPAEAAVVSYATETDPHANLAAVTGARIVVLAVKPDDDPRPATGDLRRRSSRMPSSSASRPALPRRRSSRRCRRPCRCFGRCRTPRPSSAAP